MSSSPASVTPAVIACNLSARDLAIRSDELRRQLFGAVTEVRELPDGFAFRFPESDDVRTKLFEFVGTERGCCSFFRIELHFEPELGPIWLQLRGGDGVKDFVRQQFGGLEQI
ncbi:MAG: hypothetical protein H0V24_17655 [Chloroflexia bacterium]|nr:hypothetical protein [Chloroflexia bacterium]MDQ3413215.1 hypothetical protein [Chloroflexota bacterium]